MRVLAVDFGTSNTVAAVAVDGAPPRTLAIDGSPLLPSSIFLTDDGTIAVGRDADRQARLDPSRYEPNPKRRIDDGQMLLGSEVVEVRQAISAVLNRVAQEFRRQNQGHNPDVVRLTHPARWRQARKDVLVGAAKDAGLGDNPILVPEPVGAATHFAKVSGHTMPPGSAIAVYDLGGGTFDVAIVQKRGENFEVLAEAGLPDLGGLDFDHAIWEQIGRSQGRIDAEEWAKLNRPIDTASRRAQRALAVDVKEGKEALSRHPHTDIALPDPFSDVHLTRSEFEDLIRPNLARSVELLATTVSDANFTPSQLVGVYLVGGSSRIPLVARLIQEGLGITPTTLDQPEATVVSGALFLNVVGAPNPVGPGAQQAQPNQGQPNQGQPNQGHPNQGQPANRGGPPSNSLPAQLASRPLPPGAQQRPASVAPPSGQIGLPVNPTGSRNAQQAPGHPMTGPQHPAMPPAVRRPVQEPTRRVSPGDLPNLNTYRGGGAKPPNVRRLPAPNPVVGQRPQTGGVPPVRRGPANPNTGAMAGPGRQAAGPRSGTQPAANPAAGAAARPAALAQSTSGGAAPETNYRPIIWAALFAVTAILIAILIAYLT